MPTLNRTLSMPRDIMEYSLYITDFIAVSLHLRHNRTPRHFRLLLTAVPLSIAGQYATGMGIFITKQLDPPLQESGARDPHE
jgi:hypothetical protein